MDEQKHSALKGAHNKKVQHRKRFSKSFMGGQSEKAKRFNGRKLDDRSDVIDEPHFCTFTSPLASYPTFFSKVHDRYSHNKVYRP